MFLTTCDRDIEAALGSAISQRIGEPRYQLWFQPNTKFTCRENGLVFSCCSALKNDLTPVELLENTSYQLLVEHILESKRRKRLKINGSYEELEFILRFKQFSCYPTMFARIYPNGDVYYPCVPLKTVGGNLFEIPSIEEIYRRARKEFGDVPDCRGRCHLYSNVTSHFYVHKFWNLAAEYR